MGTFELLEKRQQTEIDKFLSEGISSNDFTFLSTGVQKHEKEFKKSNSSEDIKETNINIPIDPDHLKKFSSILSQKIHRVYYTKQILSCLDWLSENHLKDEPSSFNYISKLLINIKDFIRDSPGDPYSGFLLAVYDGLSVENFWLNAESNVFEKIGKYLKELNNQELTYKKVDKYIHKLELLGLNVLPY